MNVAELFVKCLEKEGVEYVFVVPGEEILDLMAAIERSSIKLIITRHEQGAAFMADMYGRIEGKPAVALSTLGPGATNMVTAVASANMDHSPLIAVAGQGKSTNTHKETHQIINLQKLFEPITKLSSRILYPETVPEIVRQSFKQAKTEKNGAVFIELPEDIASTEVDNLEPILKLSNHKPRPSKETLESAVKIINNAKNPVAILGYGITRGKATKEIAEFIKKTKIPAATTFMGKGVIPTSDENYLGTIGLKARDYISYAFFNADVVISIGVDFTEYLPIEWNPTCSETIVHIDTTFTEVDFCYEPAVEVTGDLVTSLKYLTKSVNTLSSNKFANIRKLYKKEQKEAAVDNSFPVKPLRVVSDIRKALPPDGIVISDVGAHKFWLGRSYEASKPNTCFITNGFCSMGISLPSAIAAKLVRPKTPVIVSTGDAGFLMNCQELETAIRLKTSFVILVWNDSQYGLIRWKQENLYNSYENIDFANPDFIKFAESFGAKGIKIDSTEKLLPALKEALKKDTVTIIDCPVDYSENIKLSKKLSKLSTSDVL